MLVLLSLLVCFAVVLFGLAFVTPGPRVQPYLWGYLVATVLLALWLTSYEVEKFMLWLMVFGPGMAVAALRLVFRPSSR